MKFTHLVGICLALASPLKAVPLPADASQPVQEVLRAESQEPLDRREALAQLRKTANPAARWHSGWVQAGDEWTPFDETRLSGPAAELRRRYLDERRAAPQTVEGQRRLALWCVGRKLPSQAYAHWLASVLAEPEGDHRGTLRRLGYRFIHGTWVSPEELDQWARDLKAAQTSMTIWGAPLARAREQLTGAGRQREAALRTLEAAQQVAAVPALEWSLCGYNEPAALAAIDRLKSIDAFESTQALARQAVFNAWESVRDAATEGLAERRFEDYVPSYVALLSTPIEGRFSIETTRGSLAHNWIMGRETSNQFEIAAYESHLDIVNSGHFGGMEWNSLLANAEGGVTAYARNARTRLDALRQAEREQLATEQRVALQNAQADEINNRISTVLASVTGESNRETPRDWWDWWDGYNQYEKKRPKPVRRVVRKQAATVVLAPPPVAVPSCLVAGTIVWTDDGPRAIEQLSTGDLILSQQIESGELGYIPVLQTTERAPTSVYRIETTSQSITATGGHRFWVSGEGWRRVNDLKPGILLHTATGSVAVTAIEPVPEAAVYNVVVAPTHNYFVGEQALLTHDVTLPRPTNRKVPGLVEP